MDDHSSGSKVALALKQSTRIAGLETGTTRSLFDLASGGVCRACLLPDERCALTTPFHPYPHFRRSRWRYLSVALSVRSLCPGVTWHRFPVKSGLSSPTEIKAVIRPSGGETMRRNQGVCQIHHRIGQQARLCPRKQSLNGSPVLSNKFEFAFLTD